MEYKAFEVPKVNLKFVHVKQSAKGRGKKKVLERQNVTVYRAGRIFGDEIEDEKID